jgi:hypothetical protein
MLTMLALAFTRRTGVAGLHVRKPGWRDGAKVEGIAIGAIMT